MGQDILVGPSPGHPSRADPRVRGRRMQYQLSRVVIGPALYVLGRPRVTGLEYVPASGPAILASNHLSFIDSMYLPLVIPRPVVFPAKAEYFSAKGPLGRLWAAYLRSTNQLQMDRSDSKSAQATLEAAAGILRAGDLFGFYPEGTRPPDGRLPRARGDPPFVCPGRVLPGRHQVARRPALPWPGGTRLAGAEHRRPGDPGGHA